MLEVLITLVIIATALLGTAGLQIYAMKVSKSSQFRTQAVFLASDFAERMEANKVAAIAGNYVVAPASSVPAFVQDCAANPCDSTTLAQWDINQWERAIIAMQLPQPTWAVSQVAAGNPSTYQITIGWTDRSVQKTGHTETFSYVSGRTVRN